MPRFNVGPQMDFDKFEKLKPIIVKLLRFASKYVDVPTYDNTTRSKNTLRFIEIRDEFFQHLDNDTRDRDLRVIIDIGIWLFDYDSPYRKWIDWWVIKLREGEWPEILPKTPYNWGSDAV